MLYDPTTQNRTNHSDALIEAQQVHSGYAYGIGDFIAMLRRRIWLILAVTGLVAGATMVYVLLENPRYEATATIVLDSRKARPNEEIASLVSTGAGADQTVADSQVEVIKSESIALTVIDKLKLDQDPTFYAPKKVASAAMAKLRGWIGTGGPLASPRSLALDAMKDALSVERIGTSYAISVRYGYPDPARSADITNAFVDAYQVKQAEARDALSERTTGWLRTRLDELRKKSLDIDTEMQALRQGGSTAGGGRTIALLKDLERESDTYRTLYQTFLSRYQQAVEQEALPIDEARVVTHARPPIEPVYPRKSLFLALSLFIGGALGVGLATLLEVRDQTVRTPQDVTDASGLPYLGLLPVIGRTRLDATGGDRLLRYVSREPASLYAETLRALVGRLDAASKKRSLVVGFCSVSPGDAGAIVSSNFAFTLASLGRSTLLVDADTRRPTLRRSFKDGDIAPGLRLASLPGAAASEEPASSAVTKVLSNIIDSRSDDCVVIKLPPLGIADAATIARMVDHLVLVVEWAADSRQAVKSVVDAESEIQDKWLGALVANVDLSKLMTYDRSGVSETAQKLNTAYFGSTRPSQSAA